MKYKASRLVSKAYHYLEKQNFAKALELLEKACSADPNSDEIYAYLGEAYVHNERYEDAMKAFDDREKLTIKAEYLNPYIDGYRGRIYFELGDLDKAEEFIGKALAADAKDPEILYGKALLHGKKNEVKKALETLRELDFYEPTFYHRKINMLLKKIPDYES